MQVQRRQPSSDVPSSSPFFRPRSRDMDEIEREENEGEAQPLDEQTRSRAQCLFEQHRERILKRTDRLFAGLMAAQWVAGVLAALWISPRAWSGAESRVHVHVWAAVFLGGAIAAFPIFLALARRALDTAHHRRGPDARVGSSDPSHRRTHRDALSCLRIARLPRLLQGLAGSHLGIFHRRSGSLPSRRVLARLGLRSARAELVAMAGARRLGHLRGLLSDHRLPAGHEGNEGARPPSGLRRGAPRERRAAGPLQDRGTEGERGRVRTSTARETGSARPRAVPRPRSLPARSYPCLGSWAGRKGSKREHPKTAVSFVLACPDVRRETIASFPALSPEWPRAGVIPPPKRRFPSRP